MQDMFSDLMMTFSTYVLFQHIDLILRACGYIVIVIAIKKETANFFAFLSSFFFMLNSAEYEILNAHKYKIIKKFSFFQAQISLQCYFSC